MNKRVKNSHFSERLKHLRRNMGYRSAESFAQHHHFAVETYKEWEIKGHTPVLNNLIELAEIFNVSVDYLLGRSNTIHVENKEISEITGLSEDAIEVLRYIRNTKTPDFVWDLDDTEGHNRVVVDMINELLEDSIDSIQIAKRKNDESPSIYHIGSIFTLFYQYIYSDSARIDNNENQFLWFNLGFHDVMESGPALYREMIIKRIEQHLNYLRTKRTKLTKSDVRLALLPRDFKQIYNNSNDFLFVKFNKYYSVIYDCETNQYSFVLYEGNGEDGVVKKRSSFAKEIDKRITLEHLINAVDMIEKESNL